MTSPEPESQTVPETGDLGLSPGQWMDLQFDYNAGLAEPQEGTVEAEAFRRMDGDVRRDYELCCQSERADAAYRTWAEAHPEEAAALQAEAEAEWAEPEWDSEDSNAYQDRVEAGLEPEAEL